jgi:uncharacterized protein (TIGR02266 family)
MNVTPAHTATQPKSRHPETAVDAALSRLARARNELVEALANARKSSDAEVPAAASLAEAASVEKRLAAPRVSALRALEVCKRLSRELRHELLGCEAELDGLEDQLQEELDSAGQRWRERCAEAEIQKARELKARVTVRPPPPPVEEDERRCSKRIGLCAEITLGSDSNFFTGFTNDVSEGGVFVATVNLLPIGTQIDLAFTLPGGACIEGRGEVRWLREHDERNLDAFAGMGIRFVNLETAALGAITRFMAERDPMFFPDA